MDDSSLGNLGTARLELDLLPILAAVAEDEIHTRSSKTAVRNRWRPTVRLAYEHDLEESWQNGKAIHARVCGMAEDSQPFMFAGGFLLALKALEGRQESSPGARSKIQPIPRYMRSRILPGSWIHCGSKKVIV